MKSPWGTPNYSLYSLAESKAQFFGGPNMKPNLRPGLVPPEGTMWRGATIETPPNNLSGAFTGDWTKGADPQEFEDYYGQPLHIYRNFNENSNASLLNDTAA